MACVHTGRQKECVHLAIYFSILDLQVIKSCECET